LLRHQSLPLGYCFFAIAITIQYCCRHGLPLSLHRVVRPHPPYYCWVGYCWLPRLLLLVITRHSSSMAIAIAIHATLSTAIFTYILINIIIIMPYIVFEYTTGSLIVRHTHIVFHIHYNKANIAVTQPQPHWPLATPCHELTVTLHYY